MRALQSSDFCPQPINCLDRLVVHLGRGKNQNALSIVPRGGAGRWPKSVEKR